jgi:hypothetical protein
MIYRKAIHHCHESARAALAAELMPGREVVYKQQLI